MLFIPTPQSDSRGFFCRIFDKEVVRRAGIEPDSFAQDSVSRSSRECSRGLHLRRGDGEAKSSDAHMCGVFDVVVDPYGPTSRRPSVTRKVRTPWKNEGVSALRAGTGCAHGISGSDGSADVTIASTTRSDPLRKTSPTASTTLIRGSPGRS